MDKAKFRGLTKVEIQFLLTAIAINLKKMVKKVDIDRIRSSVNRIKTIFTQFKNNVFEKLIARLAILPS